jgi:hypothetical protein
MSRKRAKRCKHSRLELGMTYRQTERKRQIYKETKIARD